MDRKQSVGVNSYSQQNVGNAESTDGHKLDKWFSTICTFADIDNLGGIVNTNEDCSKEH